MRCNANLGLALVLIAAGSSTACAQTSTSCALSNGVTLEPPILEGTVRGGSSRVITSKLLAVMNQGSPDFVVVAAHRGDWYACAENTVESLQQAISERIEAIEVDARFSQDGTLVLSHDADLLKETNWNVSQNGRGLVSETNWSKIQSLQVRDRRGNVQPESQIGIEGSLKSENLRGSGGHIVNRQLAKPVDHIVVLLADTCDYQHHKLSKRS